MTAHACRFCRAPLTRSFIDLGRQPVSNDYLTQAQLDAGDEPVYPLHVWTCDQCFLVQAEDPVAHDDMFTAEYAYFSSFSEAWLKHCQAFAAMAVNRFDLGPESQVVEVASNDGYLLQYFKAEGVPVLGVEPTANTAAAAVAKGIPTEVRFFGEATGADLARRGVRADLMFGANVLAHVPDINDFMAGFPQVLKPEGTLVFEFPHLLRMIEAVQFDTIYHEHFSYLSLLAVEQVLAAHGLRAYDVEELWTHGGSLRLYCCHADAPFETTDALLKVREDEEAARFDSIEGYEGFTARAEAVRDSFLAFLRTARAEGRKVAAYGAAAKGNTFLNYAHVGTDDIVCVFDRNPAKQGRYLPGSHLPILSPDAIAEVRPDYVVILPWNLKDEIVEQLAFIRDWGGRFVTASPETRVVE
jgi:SAM-dependent methyltransferase